MTTQEMLIGISTIELEKRGIMFAAGPPRRSAGSSARKFSIRDFDKRTRSVSAPNPVRSLDNRPN